ncbi:MAG: HlyD family efflux transporter periplasmic adaptor subunit, partial [Rhodospirillales bacterium]|nr:HlyD family efflux transporter periplasmic adaptor subunit [Rhodospirillales bacterium]
INSRIQSLMSERDLAQTTYSRSKKLFESGTIPKARLDETESALKVIERNLNAMQAERRVITQQMTEGEVLAPTQGRVIRVDVTTGTVVLAGEPIAIIAGQGFILRMRVPERHARFLKGGDRVLLGARGADERALEPGAPLREGIIRQVYPKLEQGRVVADISVTDLGDYFVGERISVYVNTGDRRIIVVPQAYLFQRYGLTFVRLKDGSEVVVQPGQNTIGGIEILSGLRVGDILIRPSSDGT